jgi:hypothetical protein
LNVPCSERLWIESELRLPFVNAVVDNQVFTLRHLRRPLLEGAIDDMCLDAGGSRFGDSKEAMVWPVPNRKKL